ncbi:MAG TPA: hypothetical protein VHY91_14675 [Pirellulales bacterium]|jgi:hypothetical protein|nr:hypothetical protein [Pirellulales bacterium]
MRRKVRFGRRPNYAVERTDARPNQFHASFEELENRLMLSADDLLIGLYDGGGTLRYNEAADVPAPGVVAPGDNGLASVSGEAVAPDGTFYVSSPDTGDVYHYSNSGTFLGVLGENDMTQSPLEYPGTLAFGPDGNLYVADLATSAIYQFNVNSATQQYQPDDTITLAPDDPTIYPPGEVPTPGGFTFAANGDLIVGDLSDGSVANYHDGTRTSYYITPYTAIGSNDTSDTNDPFLNPAAILAENNGNLLIADIDFDYSNDHHQVVEYNAATQTTSQFINFSTPLGTNGPNSDDAGDYAQPESLLLDQDGNLLVGVSPDDNDNGAVQQYNINNGVYINTIVSGISTPAALAYIPAETSDLLVADYDNSAVLRYDDSSDAGYPAVPGGVAAGSNGGALNTAAGIAVASNGTYYVSSAGTGEVLHYSSNGTLLGALGENDAIQSPLEMPGTLAFGPDGNLYVADLATSAIYQFNVNSPAQQYQPGGTITLAPDDPTIYPPGEVPVPGGFTFATNGDLIVGDLSDGSVANYHDGTRTGYYITPYTAVGCNDTNDTNDPFLNPAAILAESNGNLLIADIDFDYSNDHHQVVEYNAATQTTSRFINFSTPLGTNGPNSDDAGNYAQPESLLLDQDGNLLVGVSPDDNDNGAVQEYDINTGDYISTVVSGIGTPAGLVMIQQNIAPGSIVSTNQALVDVTAGQAFTLDQNLTISSADASVTAATVSIGAGFVSGADTLNFANQNGISGSYNSSTGVLTLSGSATPAQYQAALQSITFSSNSSSIATRAVSYVVNDADDPGATSTNTASLDIVVSPPIAITGAYVAGSAWTTPSYSNSTERFDSYLVSHGLGDATVPTVGYALQTGSAQTTTLPWANINTISVSFSGPVNDIGLGSLKLVGGTGGGSLAAPSVTGFTSDGNDTYSWSLSGNLGNNKYIFAIATTGSSFGTPGSTQITDANGAGISGTFTTSSSTFPSGNGLAGSTFDFAFNVLPGDGNQSANVNAVDGAGAKALNNDHETSAGYNPYYDYKGAGIINASEPAIDAAAVNAKQSSITAPTAPADSQVGSVGSSGTGFTALALGVQETGSSSSASTTSTASNVVSAGTTPAATTIATSTSDSASGAATSSITTPQSAANLATDEALSAFDLADLWI